MATWAREKEKVSKNHQRKRGENKADKFEVVLGVTVSSS